MEEILTTTISIPINKLNKQNIDGIIRNKMKSMAGRPMKGVRATGGWQAAEWIAATVDDRRRGCHCELLVG